MLSEWPPAETDSVDSTVVSIGVADSVDTVDVVVMVVVVELVDVVLL